MAAAARTDSEFLVSYPAPKGAVSVIDLVGGAFTSVGSLRAEMFVFVSQIRALLFLEHSPRINDGWDPRFGRYVTSERRQTNLALPSADKLGSDL